MRIVRNFAIAAVVMAAMGAGGNFARAECYYETRGMAAGLEHEARGLKYEFRHLYGHLPQYDILAEESAAVYSLARNVHIAVHDKAPLEVVHADLFEMYGLIRHIDEVVHEIEDIAIKEDDYHVRYGTEHVHHMIEGMDEMFEHLVGEMGGTMDDFVVVEVVVPEGEGGPAVVGPEGVVPEGGPAVIAPEGIVPEGGAAIGPEGIVPEEGAEGDDAVGPPVEDDGVGPPPLPAGDDTAGTAGAPRIGTSKGRARDVRVTQSDR